MVDKVSAPVHIINLTAKTGTTSEDDKTFKIKVSKGDELFISSVEFAPKKLKITSEILEENYLSIKLDPALNELAEVKVHNLSGNLEADIANIKVHEMPVFEIPPVETIKPRGVPNIAFEQNSQMASTPVNLLAVYKLITGKDLIKKKPSIKPVIFNEQIAITSLRKKFDEDFFKNHLKLQHSHINNFISFAFKNGLNKELLEEKNSLELIAFLEKHSKEYIKNQQLDENSSPV